MPKLLLFWCQRSDMALQSTHLPSAASGGNDGCRRQNAWIKPFPSVSFEENENVYCLVQSNGRIASLLLKPKNSFAPRSSAPEVLVSTIPAWICHHRLVPFLTTSPPLLAVFMSHDMYPPRHTAGVSCANNPGPRHQTDPYRRCTAMAVCIAEVDSRHTPVMQYGYM